MGARLGRSFFAVDAVTLARRLLGQRLVRVLDGERLAGLVVETEAYLGPGDSASHSHKWRRTARTEPMYGVPGTSYVYFTYGMHFCMNVSADREGFPSAVLIRAIEPTEGLETMRVNRPAAKRDRDLCSGPARVCAALGLDRAQSGLDTVRDRALFFERVRARALASSRIEATARVGVASAGAWATRPLRYLVAGSEWVSPGRPTTGEDVRRRASG